MTHPPSIDWKTVWKEYLAWEKKNEGCIYREDCQKKIRQLVEAQLVKKRGK